MGLDTETNNEEKTEKLDKKRRSFIKRSIYAAPTLIVMGELMRPTQSKAGWAGALPSQVK